MAPSGEQRISIIIVGGGIGGLSFGIEAHRRGHNVRVFERRPEAVESGKYNTHFKLVFLVDI